MKLKLQMCVQIFLWKNVVSLNIHLIKKGHFYFFGRCKINKTYYLSDSYYFFKSRLTIGIMIYGFPYFLTKYINIHIYKRYLEPKRYKAPMPPRGFKCKKCCWRLLRSTRQNKRRRLNKKKSVALFRQQYWQFSASGGRGFSPKFSVKYEYWR